MKNLHSTHLFMFLNFRGGKKKKKELGDGPDEPKNGMLYGIRVLCLTVYIVCILIQ